MYQGGSLASHGIVARGTLPLPLFWVSCGRIVLVFWSQVSWFPAIALFFLYKVFRFFGLVGVFAKLKVVTFRRSGRMHRRGSWNSHSPWLVLLKFWGGAYRKQTTCWLPSEEAFWERSFSFSRGTFLFHSFRDPSFQETIKTQVGNGSGF